MILYIKMYCGWFLKLMQGG